MERLIENGEPILNGIEPLYKVEKRIFKKLGELENIEEELGIDLVILFRALKNGIYGTMYGETVDKLISDIIRIKPQNFKLCLHIGKPCLYYIWGWPGPDSTSYYFKDYGKTWALTKEELL